MAYHLQTLLQILQMAVQILQTDLVMQSLVTLPEVVGHLRVHVMDLGITPLAQILHRLPVGIPDPLQFVRERMMRVKQLKLPQHREIGEMRLHLACIEMVQIIEHRTQLVQQREDTDEAILVEIHISGVLPCSVDDISSI